MEHVLHDMIIALRSSGVRISPSETMDAMHAARLMGYADRQILKDSLSAALAKTQGEKEIFETCFDRFFSLDGFSDAESHPSPVPIVEPHPEDAPLTQMLLFGDNAGLSMSMREAAQAIDMKGIRFFTQKSLYIQQILKGMGIEGVERDIRRISKEGVSSSEQKAMVLKGAKDFLFEGVRDFVEQQFSLFAASATEEIMEKYLRGVRLSNLEHRDFHRMQTIVRKMVKRLNNLHSRRRKTSKRGSLDFKKTLRTNIASQGVLFKLRWKARRIDRPDIVAICDISRSVEAVARFMLLFLHSLSEAVARIRSFVFCSNLVEVSHVFEEHPVEEALERLQKGVGLGVILGRTDYGQAFRDFKGHWLDEVTKKTTVLILGDGRNNYGDPQTDILKLIRERSKTLIWLNPEPPSFWGIGDSEMKRYLPCCYLVKECSTVNHLQRLVDLLLRTGG
ncbi:MAG: VWA domain-containing protein [Deltaproteobacteria bacterium]|nr:VWA domain-containing protein [Deltaproteobacteria bacterium]